MSYMFSNCTSLLSLPDISNWDMSNVVDIDFMFYNCQLLPHIPNISKWNINKMWNMSGLFANCESLVELPDISSWKIGDQICEIIFESHFNRTEKTFDYHSYLEKKKDYNPNFGYI